MLFNAVIVFTHWQNTVNASVENAAVHYGLHVLLFAASLLMWMPVCGPMPELRLSLPGQMIYLFLMSIVPTVPAAWLTFAEGVVYSAYDIPERLWGISATDDQQIAGADHEARSPASTCGGSSSSCSSSGPPATWRPNEAGRTLTEREILTWDDVKDELNVR